MAIGTVQPFSPVSTVSIAALVTSFSAPTGIAQSPYGLGNGNTECVVYNSSSVLVFVAFGSSTVVATAASYPVPPGATRIVSIGANVTTAACILASAGSGNVYFSFGSGTTY
jgi:hypothetical protein